MLSPGRRDEHRDNTIPPALTAIRPGMRPVQVLFRRCQTDGSARSKNRLRKSGAAPPWPANTTDSCVLPVGV